MTEENQSKLRRFLAVPVLFAMIVMLASCGTQNGEENKDTTTQPHVSAHEVSPEVEQKVVADATADLAAISAAGSDLNLLSGALTGKALEDTKTNISQDQAQGRVRVRDYQNIKVRLQDFSAPIAQVFAEFDDYGYYVDANTGAALTEPTKEHKTYALALVEEGGKWKIQGIFASTGTTTTSTPPQ